MTKPFTVEQLRCLELGRIIREGLPGVRFDMSKWGECGTVGCIAGYTCAVYDQRTWASHNCWYFHREARKLLGLSWLASFRLFLFPGIGWKLRDITPTIAAATLTNLGLTGKVEWPKP